MGKKREKESSKSPGIGTCRKTRSQTLKALNNRRAESSSSSSTANADPPSPTAELAELCHKLANRKALRATNVNAASSNFDAEEIERNSNKFSIYTNDPTTENWLNTFKVFYLKSTKISHLRFPKSQTFVGKFFFLMRKFKKKEYIFFLV